MGNEDNVLEANKALVVVPSHLSLGDLFRFAVDECVKADDDSLNFVVTAEQLRECLIYFGRAARL